MAERNERPAEEKAEQAPGELDEFEQFEALVGKGVPSRVAVAAVSLSRAGDDATAEQMSRFADLVWNWIDREIEERQPPTRNGRRREPWRPFGPRDLWREATEGGGRSG